MQSNRKPSSQKRSETNPGHLPSDENIAPKKLSPSKTIHQNVSNPKASPHTTNDPRQSTLAQAPNLAKASEKKRFRFLHYFSAVVAAVASLVTILQFAGVVNIESLFYHPAPITLTPASVKTPASFTNICGGGTGSNPVGFTFCIYRGHKGPVRAVVWSPDGKRIASGGWDGTVQVWDALTGGNVITYKGHKRSVNAVAWSPNGQQIASGGDDGTVQIWLSGDASHVYTLSQECCGSVTAIAWSPDGQSIAVGTQDGFVNIFSGINYDHISDPSGNKVHTDAVTALAFSPDSNSFASASSDGTVKIGGKLEKTYPRPDYVVFNVTALAWSPDGKSIAYTSFDGGSAGFGDVIVRSVSQGNEAKPEFDSDLDLINGPIVMGNSIAWACNSNYLAIGEVTGHIDILDISQRKVNYSYLNHSKQVNAVAWSPDGTKIASGSDDGTVKVWQAPTGLRCNA